ncbi:MAG: TPM domain-containing protein [Bacteroidota bacterium]
MSKVEDFLSKTEEDHIIEAIRFAENRTSGEIRVHLERNCQGDVYDHALEVFHHLKMDNTRLQNGVLIYVAIERREFVILGDKGINDVVGDNFWNTTRDHILEEFKKGDYAKGLMKGITEAGEALSKYFPWEHNDADELDNSISKA